MMPREHQDLSSISASVCVCVFVCVRGRRPRGCTTNATGRKEHRDHSLSIHRFATASEANAQTNNHQPAELHTRTHFFIASDSGPPLYPGQRFPRERVFMWFLSRSTIVSLPPAYYPLGPHDPFRSVLAALPLVARSSLLATPRLSIDWARVDGRRGHWRRPNTARSTGAGGAGGQYIAPIYCYGAREWPRKRGCGRCIPCATLPAILRATVQTRRKQITIHTFAGGPQSRNRKPCATVVQNNTTANERRKGGGRKQKPPRENHGFWRYFAAFRDN